MATFSSSVVPSAAVTWKSHALPKIVTTGGPASTSAWRLPSSCGRTPGRRGAPDARRLGMPAGGRAHAGPAGGAERADLGGLEHRALHALEEAQVLRIRAGPAALDVGAAEGADAPRAARPGPPPG